jgi:hypothetical protein
MHIKSRINAHEPFFVSFLSFKHILLAAEQEVKGWRFMTGKQLLVMQIDTGTPITQIFGVFLTIVPTLSPSAS